MHSEVAKGALRGILKQTGLTLAEFLDLLYGTLEGLGALVEPIKVGFRTGDDG
jgi:hypothetical protein